MALRIRHATHTLIGPLSIWFPCGVKARKLFSIPIECFHNHFARFDSNDQKVALSFPPQLCMMPSVAFVGRLSHHRPAPPVKKERTRFAVGLSMHWKLCSWPAKNVRRRGLREKKQQWRDPR